MVQTFCKECMERLYTSNVSISIGSREIYCKNWFSDRVLYITISNADIWSLKSLHALFDKYLDHMLVTFEQSCMVRTIQNFELIDKKWLTILTKDWRHSKRRSCDWNNCLMLNYDLKTIIFQCSKNYGSPTRVTRLKVAPNMADPISLNEKKL